MQEIDSPGKSAPVIRLLLLVKAMGLDDLCETVDVFREEDRIVNQFLVTLVTERGGREIGRAHV